MSITFDANRPIDLICMGRVAVDLYAEQIHSPLSQVETFRKYLGGCPGNIAVGTARLGLMSMMFSCVGQDEMGQFLKETLQKEGVKIDLLYETAQHLTALVLLGISPPHHFPLMFYRKDCADMQLQPAHVKQEILQQAKALLITGTGLSTPSMEQATHHAVQRAKQVGTAVIMDLDYRPVLWGLTSVGDGETRYKSSQIVTEHYQKILSQCDLIVGTEEEVHIAGGIDVIRQFTNAPVVIKKGEKGCQVYIDNNPPIASRSFPVEILNVLGAGDAFLSGLVRGLLRGESWETAMTYANANGALVVTRHGCAPAMPYFDELQEFIHHYDSNPEIWKTLPHAQGFKEGLNPIIDMKKTTDMNFSCLKLRMGERYDLTSHLESAYLLMTGKVIFNYANQSYLAERCGYFEQDPIVLHCSANTIASVQALTDCEILITQTENDRHFSSMIFDQHNLLESDHRGKGLLEDTSYRIVRTVFDKRNRPESNLVVGEIITFQGSWSSYPPHYHAHEEIYHYRFSEPQGFAFGENGKEALKIHHNDTYHIKNGQEHAHCTAPGYALYTLWVIRHLPDQPYYLPTFRPEHEWTRHVAANRRVWRQ
ncbi:MAG: 5-dehydro-2-deoxygluconokinase [Gammaproteobacteria bacterium]|nr:MAG: 5-dehydro-2-deoxygluconokinase [Gammaproteobacteria bacterium]